MSDWQVNLILQDAKSNKFWRARCIGNALEVNYGRIGGKGQRQVKRYDSPHDAASELAKQVSAKRKKGYGDDPQAPGGAGAVTASADLAAVAQAGGAGRAPVELVLPLEGRSLELRLSLAGDAVQTLAIERYASAAEAEAAFERLQDALAAEGYRPK